MDTNDNELRRPGSIHAYLDDIPFPTSKQHLVSALQQGHAPETLIDRVRKIAADEFQSAQEVMRGLQAS